MEPLVSMFEIARNIGDWIGYFNGLEGNMQNLKRQIEYLSAQESDIEAKLSCENRPQKRLKKEVEVWLRDVPQLKNDVQRLEQEVVGERSVLSRLWLGKRVVTKIQEVTELQEKGKAFDGLQVDEPFDRLLIPPTKGLVESTESRNMERVWECLMNDDVRQIGVYGMGGVGKTTIMKHIYNRLVKQTNELDGVFWVTVSKAFDIIKLQSDIAMELKFRLSDDKDERRRSSELYTALSRRKFILIIDDLWEAFPLEMVGIPEPSQYNGCKIVLTTRSLDVCRRMDCTAIKVELLTEQEALTLFIRKAVGPNMVLAPNVEEIACQISKECACLPLAIVTVAGSLRGLKGTRDWRNALNELISSTKDSCDIVSKVFEQLKFSYNRLENKVLQDCFLFCSLYPEDHHIPMKGLIGYWIAEGLITEMDSAEAKFDTGHAIARKLTNSCLVESFTEKNGLEYIKMHDLIRDMALSITTSSPRFMVKAGVRLESVPYDVWSEDLDKVSLMNCWITELPIRPPVCPRLTTLLINNNLLQVIPDTFFVNMHSLKVLDLSLKRIKLLPESIFNLENLHTLILATCRELKHIPSLAKLKALKEFKLTCSQIGELPKGIEELVNLRKLDLSYNETLGTFPSWKLRRLSKLQYFRIDGARAKVAAEDLMCLRQLKVVAAHFRNIQELTRYVTSQQFQGLEKYCLMVGRHNWYLTLDPGKRVCISSESVPFGIGLDQLVLPVDINSSHLDGFHNRISLSAIPSLKDARNLRRCEIVRCKGLESIFSSSTFSEDGQISLGTVESFYLSCLPRLRVLFDGIPPPPSIHFNLKELYFSKCDAVKNIFPIQVLQNFPNLQSLTVSDCQNVEDIIAGKEETSGSGLQYQDDSSKISLPKLRMLNLRFLPRLKSIYNGVMVCQSIEVELLDCPMLRRLPLALRTDNDQATSLPALKLITAQKEWWESLEWDDPLTKTNLQPFTRFYQF